MAASITGVQSALEMMRKILTDKLNDRLTVIEAARDLEPHAYGVGTSADPLPRIDTASINLSRRFKKGKNPAIRIFVNSKTEKGPATQGSVKILKSEVACSMAFKSNSKDPERADIALRIYADAITSVLKENYYDSENYNSHAGVTTMNFSSAEEASSLVEQYDLDGIDTPGSIRTGTPTFEMLTILIEVTQRVYQPVYQPG